MDDPAVENARCPRCGYDQRGMTATWGESCPLEAICTECGLVYSCAELLRPEKFEPRWCVEYCERGWRTFVTSIVGTLARSFLPWRFWSRLRMSHRIRPRRIALYLALLLVPFVLVYIVVQTTAALHVRSLMRAALAQQLVIAQGFLAQAVLETDEETEARMIRDHGTAVIERWKSSALDRWPEVLSERRERQRWEREWAAEAVENPPRIEGSAITAVLEAIFFPLAETTSITISGTNWYADPYPSPVELWETILDLAAVRGAFGWVNTDEWLNMIRMATSIMGFGLLMMALFPFSLALLPMSRRKAKVRWAHIGRIAAYGLFIPTVAAYLLLALVIADFTYFWLSGNLGSLAAPIALVAVGFIPLGTILWWLFAVNRHLKMPHALAVTATLMFVSFLAAIAIVYHAMPERLFPTA